MNQPSKKKSTKPSKSPKRATGKGGGGGQKKAPLTKQQKIFRGLYLALTIVSAIIVAAYIGINLFAAPPDVDGPSRLGTTVTRPPQVTTIVNDDGEEIEIEIPEL